MGEQGCYGKPFLGQASSVGSPFPVAGFGHPHRHTNRGQLPGDAIIDTMVPGQVHYHKPLIRLGLWDQSHRANVDGEKWPLQGPH